MSGLRVCEVVKTLDVGGVETLLVERLRQSAGGSEHYTVVCFRASTSELVDQLDAAGIAVVNLSSGPRALIYARLVRTVRTLAPDVINMHSPMPAVMLRPFLRLRRRRPRLVSTVHSVQYRPTTMALDRLTRGLDDHTVAVTPFVSRSATVRGARRVSTRVHGVDVAEQRHWAARSALLRREFGVPEDAFLLVTVANFRPVKDHQLLIRAAARVARARADAMFLLAGSGPLRDDVIRDVERRRLGRQVRVLGHVPRAKRLIAAADLLVLSSRYEGLPVAVMEALAAGVPVVSTAVGGIADLISSGRNGILAEPGSPDALAGAVLAAMEPSTHRQLRSGAAASAPRVDMASTAAWFEELYHDLTARADR